MMRKMEVTGTRENNIEVNIQRTESFMHLLNNLQILFESLKGQMIPWCLYKFSDGQEFTIE